MSSPSTPPAPRRAAVRARQLMVVAISVALAAVMVVLGIWQMGVYRSQGQRTLQERAAQPAVSLDQALASGQQLGDLYGTQVTLHGHYGTEATVVVGTVAPYRIVSAFHDGSRVFAVVRGTVDTLSQAIPKPPSGTVDQTGLLVPSDVDATGVAPSGAPSSWLPGVRTERLAQQWPLGVQPAYVSLGDADARAQSLTAATVQFPEASGHLRNGGYALQWWLFAAFSLVAGAVVARSMGRSGAKS